MFALLFDKKSGTLYSGSADRTVRSWQLASAAADKIEGQSFGPFPGWISGLGRTENAIAAVDYGGHVTLCKPTDGEVIARYRVPRVVLGADVAPIGKLLALCTNDSEVCLVQLP